MSCNKSTLVLLQLLHPSCLQCSQLHFISHFVLNSFHGMLHSVLVMFAWLHHYLRSPAVQVDSGLAEATAAATFT